MSNKDKFLKTYNHPIRSTEVASNDPGVPVGAVSPKATSKWFTKDERNLGGRRMIFDQLQRHQEVLKQGVEPVVKDQVKPPHAHISKVKGSKTDFKGPSKRKKKHTIGSILTRKTQNIN